MTHPHPAPAVNCVEMNQNPVWECRLRSCVLCRAARAHGRTTRYVPPPPPLALRRRQLERRGILGLRKIAIAPIEEPCAIGQPIAVDVVVRYAPRRQFRLVIELVMRALLRRNGATVCECVLSAITVNGIILNGNGRHTATIELSTENDAIHPCGHFGALTVIHELRARLTPGKFYQLTATTPVLLIGAGIATGPGAGSRFHRARIASSSPHITRHMGSYPHSQSQSHTHTHLHVRLRQKSYSIENIVNALPHPTTTTIQDEHDEVCPICFDSLSARKAVVLPCVHRLHADCAKEWFKRKPVCPMCKTSIL